MLPSHEINQDDGYIEKSCEENNPMIYSLKKCFHMLEAIRVLKKHLNMLLETRYLDWKKRLNN